MRLVIDYGKCRKTGQCSYLHPELFKSDTDGAPIVLVKHPEGELLTAAEDAIDLCPSGAISWGDE